MAFDSKLLIANETGITASTNSTGFDLFSAGYRIPMWVRVEVTGGSSASGASTLTFSIEHSTASGSGYVAHTSGADQVVTITSGGSVRDRDVVWIPLLTDKRYVRLVMTKGGAGTLSAGAYNAQITNSHPQ